VSNFIYLCFLNEHNTKFFYVWGWAVTIQKLAKKTKKTAAATCNYGSIVSVSVLGLSFGFHRLDFWLLWLPFASFMRFMQH